jgi:hypothetical protein
MAMMKKSQMNAKVKGPGDGIIISRWNSYLSWLQQKGKRGSKELDKGTEGMNLLNQYNSEMKSKDKSFTPITKDDVGKVQLILRDYRDYAMDEIRQGRGKARLTSGQELPYKSMNEQQKQEFETQFMPQIRRREMTGGEWADMIPGSETTGTFIPMNYAGLVESGVRQPLQLMGLATEKVMPKQEAPMPKKKTSMVTQNKK